MAHLISIGERMFLNPSGQGGLEEVSQIVDKNLSAEGAAVVEVDGSDPKVYIGGVARLAANQIHEAVKNGHTVKVVDEPNTDGVSSRAYVNFTKSK